jgi:ATP-dependent DNA helicase UvrD/PcrA
MTVEEELKAATYKILESTARRKLIIAGPGAGKTWTFKRLLERAPGDAESRLVLTFINSLTSDLARDLADLATVRTFHSYCFGVLKKNPRLRRDLRDDFVCQPHLASIVKDDWRYLHGTDDAPAFVDAMRCLDTSVDKAFFLARSAYYNAVEFDDAVYRVHQSWKADSDSIPLWDLILIDEFQDFNPLEVGVIEALAEKSPIVIAGDDDQALYGQLRRATWDYIRALHLRGDYEVFELPFCMRCTDVIVNAVNDILATAMEQGRLQGRIVKRYDPYPPKKGDDSAKYPHIDHVKCSVQRLNANYFGRYIAQQVLRIPAQEIAEAHEANNAPALVIGQSQYLDQIESHLRSIDIPVVRTRGDKSQLRREDGLRLLKKDAESNLGWRIVLAPAYSPAVAEVVQKSIVESVPLTDLLSEEFRRAVLAEAEALDEPEDLSTEPTVPDNLYVKLVTFEGAKGLSAQHVYVVGLHERELPRNADKITDREICVLLVALTRAKKKCSLLVTDRFAQIQKRPSIFLSWIRAARRRIIRVDARYWRT